MLANNATATEYCGRSYSQLAKNAPRPYNAVGYLSNGCTATLIDSNHILAAGHCFTGGDGTWQPNLRFYANFTPDYVTADPTHVPRANVGRAVVGSRTDVGRAGNDWGIAALGNWIDASGLDLTPAALAPSVPTVGSPLVNPSYMRGHFPYNDKDAVTWDNMEWDNMEWDNMEWDNRVPGEDVLGGCAPFGGMWAVVAKSAPLYDGVHRDQMWCNARWSWGYINGGCSLKSSVDDYVLDDCNATGGASGSPLFYQNGTSWSVVGVTHGGPHDFGVPKPVCTTATASSADNGGPSVNRFRDAPRFAYSVAVARRPDGAAATSVFAVDSDRNTVVMRSRSGSAPSHSSGFDWWTSLGSPHAGSLGKIAACEQPNGRPQIFVFGPGGHFGTNIYIRAVQATGDWGPWVSFGKPVHSTGLGGMDIATGLSDMDTTYDAAGRCQLFLTDSTGHADTIMQSSDGVWGSWAPITSAGSFYRIAALRSGSILRVVMTDPSGQIWSTQSSGGVFSAPVKLPLPSGVLGWADLAMTLDASSRPLLVATPKNLGSTVLYQYIFGTRFQTWNAVNTQLYAPLSTNDDGSPKLVPPPELVSLTAAAWQEDTDSNVSPVIFGTDDQGNIYFIEYQRVLSTPGWVTAWKSFYDAAIPY
jgi:hypothetical protein